MSETAKIFEVGSEQYIDMATYERLQTELISARAENEKLMNVEYWPERARNAEKRVAELEVMKELFRKQADALRVEVSARKAQIELDNKVLLGTQDQFNEYSKRMNIENDSLRAEVADVHRIHVANVKDRNAERKKLTDLKQRAEKLVEAAQDWTDETEAECDFQPGWQALSEALQAFNQPSEKEHTK